MKYTHNLNLKKPEPGDEYDIQNENDNMDILDLAFNAGDIVKVQKEEEIGEPTEEKKRSLYYAYDKERYSYVVHIGKFYVSNRSYGEFPTLKYDYTYNLIQHTLDNDKYYKGRRELEDVACITEEDVTFPTGTYADDTMICCHTTDVQKLYRADSTSESGFVEVLNWMFRTGDKISLDGAEDDTYYYGYKYKKLYYFRCTYWDELDVVRLDNNNPPDAAYYNNEKYFKPLDDAILYYVYGDANKDVLKWAHLYNDLQIDELIQNDINKRLKREDYMVYDQLKPSEETMGKLYYCKEQSEYKISIRDSIKVEEIGKLSDDTYQEGLEKDLPDMDFGVTIRAYYSTDTNILRVVKTQSGGLFYNYWEKVDFKEVTSKPYADYSKLGFYRYAKDGEKTIYEVRGYYSWAVLSDFNEKLSITKVEDQSKVLGAFDFNRGQVYFIESEDRYIICKQIGDNKYAWVNIGQGGIRIITIPATGWTTETDGTNTYYSIEIPVSGMSEGFVGTSGCDYVKPSPYNVSENEKRAELFSIIQQGSIESMKDKVKIMVNEIPSEPFDIRFIGV